MCHCLGEWSRGNESDRAIFAQLLGQFKQEWNLDSIYVADSVLYSTENL